MYANQVTGSMQRTIDLTNHRREIQIKYNKDHGITPEGIKKSIEETMNHSEDKDNKDKIKLNKIPKDEYPQIIREFTAQMELASANLEFEKAADLRDTIKRIKEKL